MEANHKITFTIGSVIANHQYFSPYSSMGELTSSTFQFLLNSNTSASNID
jgi:hypothetical protein